MKAISISFTAVAIIFGSIILPSIDGLAQPKDPAASAALIKSLKDKDWQIRWYAASALGEMKDAGALEPIIETLKTDDNGYVRAMAAWALGEIGDPRAVEPLIEAIEDESHDVQKGSPLALQKITGQDFGHDRAKWREWWEKNK